MKKIDLLFGFFIGIIGALLGAFLFLRFVAHMYTLSDIQMIRQEGQLGKVVTLGAILNIILFFILLNKKKELMARGVVLATIVLAIITMFV